MALSHTIKQKIFSQLIQVGDSVVFILDNKFNYVFVNDYFAKIINMPTNKIINKPFGIFKDTALYIDSNILVDDVIYNLQNKKVFEKTVVLKEKKSIKATLKIQEVIIYDEVYYTGILDESIDNIIIQNNMKNIRLDPLIQIHSEDYVIEKINELLLEKNNVEEDNNIVLVRIYFDKFRLLKTYYPSKLINKVLVTFVERIYDINPENLLLFSRLEENSFIMAFSAKDTKVIDKDLSKIIKLAKSPYPVDSDNIYLRFSIGVSQYPQDGEPAETLLNNTEKALHHIKDKGGEDIFWFSEELSQVSAEKIQLEMELREAFSDDQFFPVYQPKIDLKSKEIIGFESLVRWNHPRLGTKAPAYFLDGILEYKLSFDLFCLMAEKVVRDLYQWQQQGLTQVMCINAESYDFLHTDFTDFITNLLKKYPVKNGSLHLEVTENSLMEQYNVDIIERFTKLKKLGIHLALDDFGTGYASISYLRHYPFDYLKIDKSFIDDIENKDVQFFIVRAIIELANALNLYTVAEGIETALQEKIIYDMGCFVGQGYHFSKPVLYEQATAMITDKLPKHIN